MKKKIATLPNSEHMIKCSFCGEIYKEKRMLIFFDWNKNIWCCENENCRDEFSKIVEYYNFGDEHEI